MRILRYFAGLIIGSAYLAAQPTVIGGGYAPPYPIRVAPGQLMTIFVRGVGSSITSRVAADSLPLPYSLAGISVTVDELSNPELHGERVPLLAVGPARTPGFAFEAQIRYLAITVQI